MNTKFHEGQLVCERERPGDLFFQPLGAGAAAAKRVAGERRRGRVVRVFTKTSSSGSRLKYAEVLWDGMSSPSSHCFSRLTPVQS
jgi:hypothetical protein